VVIAMFTMASKSHWPILYIAGLGLVGLPLIGCYLAGQPIAQYLEFPPRTRYVAHAPFSTWAFFCYTFFILLIVGLLAAGGRRKSETNQKKTAPRHRPFPWWGWTALAGCLVFWILAWTRFAWFAPLQPHTFFPLWLTFIVLINALYLYRSGRCMLIHQRAYFVRLFFFSAGFWWFFEYLNRFVQNWYYTGSDYPPLTYFILATLSFSTVLPAVLGMRDLLRTFTWVENRFQTPQAKASRQHRRFRLVLPGCVIGRTGRDRCLAGPALSFIVGIAAAGHHQPAAAQRTASYFRPLCSRRLAPGGFRSPGCPGMRILLGNVEPLQPGPLDLQRSPGAPVPDF